MVKVILTRVVKMSVPLLALEVLLVHLSMQAHVFSETHCTTIPMPPLVLAENNQYYTVHW